MSKEELFPAAPASARRHREAGNVLDEIPLVVVGVSPSGPATTMRTVGLLISSPTACKPLGLVLVVLGAVLAHPRP